MSNSFEWFVQWLYLKEKKEIVVQILFDFSLVSVRFRVNVSDSLKSSEVRANFLFTRAASTHTQTYLFTHLVWRLKLHRQSSLVTRVNCIKWWMQHSFYDSFVVVVARRRTFLCVLPSSGFVYNSQLLNNLTLRLSRTKSHVKHSHWRKVPSKTNNKKSIRWDESYPLQLSCSTIPVIRFVLSAKTNHSH